MLTLAQREQLDHELIKSGHQHVHNLVEQANQAALEPDQQSEDA